MDLAKPAIVASDDVLPTRYRNDPVPGLDRALTRELT